MLEVACFHTISSLQNKKKDLFNCVFFSRAIYFFSLNDLGEGKISFVHTGVPTSRLAFRVSDGQKVSEF